MRTVAFVLIAGLAWGVVSAELRLPWLVAAAVGLILGMLTVLVASATRR